MRTYLPGVVDHALVGLLQGEGLVLPQQGLPVLLELALHLCVSDVNVCVSGVCVRCVRVCVCQKSVCVCMCQMSVCVCVYEGEGGRGDLGRESVRVH